MDAAVLFVHALTPLHAGSGQALDAIDLPITRARHTGLPYVPGSSLKGVLRAELTGRGVPTSDIGSVFGPDTAHASDFAGSTHFGDARVLLFPVRSVASVVAFLTSPYALLCFLRDRVATLGPGADTAFAAAADLVPAPYEAFVAGDALVRRVDRRDLVLVEGLDLAAVQHEAVATLAAALARSLGDDPWAMGLLPHLVVVHDRVFGHLTRQATDVAARVCLAADSKTAEKGGLWYEEALPAETLLWAPVFFAPARDPDQRAPRARRAMFDDVASAQFGGKATVGRGLCRLLWEDGEGVAA